MKERRFTVVVGVRHPFELTEEASTKELALDLGLSHSEVLLYALLGSFEQLVRSKLERKLADRLIYVG